MAKKTRAELVIFDAAGDIVHRAYVEDPSAGLRGANLEGLSAPLGQLQGLDLSDAQLYWAGLYGADLSFANFSRADLRGAILARTKCTSTNFRAANLGRDNLGGRTSVVGADFRTADLEQANLEGAVYDFETQFPDAFSPVSRGMVHMDSLDAKDPARSTPKKKR